MPRTFADDLASDAAEAFLTDFAESGTYTPKGGLERTVKADCRRATEFVQQEFGITEIEVCRVRCSRDATHAVTSGIDTPQVGDTWTLGDGEEAVTFTWEGQIEQVGPAMWTLVFTRHEPYRRGGRNLR